MGMLAGPGTAADATTLAAAPSARVEARSPDLLAVAIVQNKRMVVHLSRPLDNAPVRDAVLSVLLRGAVHPAKAEADGSYSLESEDLALAGSAAMVFQVQRPGAAREDLQGSLDITGPAAKIEDKNSARQLGWWVLNFTVCIGFLMLWSKRRKNTAEDGD